MSDIHLHAHAVRTSSLLESAKYSDVTVTCHGRDLPAHRAILCSASKVFAAACDGNFKEAQDAKLDLSVDDLATVQRMMKYLYTAGYSDEDDPFDAKRQKDQPAGAEQSASPVDDQNRASPDPPLSPGDPEKYHEDYCDLPKVNAAAITNNVLVYALADKYDIPLLKALAEDKFRARSVFVWDEETLYTILELVYSTTPTSDRGLRNVISEICSKYINVSSGDLLSGERFKEVMSNDGTLAFDVLVRISRSKRFVDARAVKLERTVKERDSVLGKHSSLIEDLRKEVRSAKQDLKSAKESTKAERQASKKLKEANEAAKIEQEALKRYINAGRTCRNCRRALNVKVEKNGLTSNSDALLKCGHCKTPVS